MSQQWDEFSKSLAEESLPRRESLKRLGAVLAGAIFGSLGLKQAVAGRNSDPCKAFCRCRNKSQQSQCIEACRACNNDTSHLYGNCGYFGCCNATVCEDNYGKYCTDLDRDPDNCGNCGNACEPPGPYEYVFCVSGECQYVCEQGAVFCNGNCTLLEMDPDNCGACGNVCGGSTPYCSNGACTECSAGMTLCGNTCTYLYYDNDNCGACGNVCGGSTPYCYQGGCTSCAGGAICNGLCTDVYWDSGNCGGCGNVCPPNTGCAWGTCEGLCIGC